ncbi:MAG: Clp protease N-terminal domain-containing protein [Candidatus Pacearchaeota archaeon]|jgi:ATP-dependent Clp protease ATP-binding subunit ClpA
MEQYEKLSEEAKVVMNFANDEAVRYHHRSISTEHILLGIVGKEECNAVYILREINAPIEQIEHGIRELICKSPDAKFEGIHYLTPKAKRALEYAERMALQFGNDYVGTEHLLLGLIRDPEGVAGSFLNRHGLELEVTELAVAEFLEKRNR